MEDKTKRIEDLIRIYGADFDRWPATEGLGRPRLDAAREAVWAEEAELDALIQHAAVPAPGAGLRARILAIPGRDGRMRAAGGFSWLLTGFWRPAGVAVGALLLGLFLGQLALAQTEQVAVADTEAETLFADLVLGPSEGPTEFLQ